LDIQTTKIPQVSVQAKKQAFLRSLRSDVHENKPLSIFHVIVIINPKQMWACIYSSALIRLL